MSFPDKNIMKKSSLQSQIIMLSLEAVPSLMKELRRKKKKIVLTQGSFDLVHIGHARYCQEAKNHGDVLFVGVDSDEKVQTRKGPNRPIVPEIERMEMLTHLKSVDYVVLKKQGAEKYALIKAIKPDVLVATAATYTEREIKDLKEFCGEVLVLQPMATTSTTAKIRLMQMKTNKKIEETLRAKLIKAVAEVLAELSEGK